MSATMEVPALFYHGDYAADLEAAWADHVAPRKADAPTVVSLFAGCGGSSLGYSMAGFRELLAVEWDANAAECLRANFPDVEVYHGDVTKLEGEEALYLTGLVPGQLDVLDGSPPCQGFSTAGRRQTDDPRNGLFREYVRLLGVFKPRAFVMENVSGMVKGKMRLLFVEILEELKKAGYRVAVRLLNAKYFGVPQSRERVIFVGVREDLGLEPSHPEPKTWPIPAKVAVRGLTREQREAVPQKDIAEKYVEWWKSIPPGDNASAPHESGTHFNVLAKLDPERPCPTIVKSASDHSFSSFVHWAEPRFIHVAEAMRFASFPDDFILTGEYKDRMSRIGNSVPPLLMRAVACNLRKILEA